MRSIIFIKDEILLETALVENQKSFFYPNFVFDNDLLIANQDLSAAIHTLINGSDTENELLPLHFDFKILPCRSTQIRHEQYRYRIVAYYLSMSTVIQKTIYKPVTYNQAIHFPKADK